MAQESPFDAVPMKILDNLPQLSALLDYDAALCWIGIHPAVQAVAVLSIILLPPGLASALSFLQKPTDVSLRETLLKNLVPCDVA